MARRVVGSHHVPAPPPPSPKLPIFDAHMHYSHDAWDSTPPKAAVAILRKAGLKRAMVSSSSDDGTQKLYAEAPDLVVPSLRPIASAAKFRPGCATKP
jgi:hypothetical protein